MIEESKYCSDMMKKRFKKELVVTKEGTRERALFERGTKGGISYRYNEYILTDTMKPITV